MAKVNREKLIRYFMDHLGTPYEVTDCSGGFVKAFKEQGASIYHGSNRIARVHVNNLRRITSMDEVEPGEAVFKIRDDLSKMKAEYKPGGRYYDPALPWDFYHIGLRVPDGEVDFTGPVSKLDTNDELRASRDLMGWDMAARLDDVDYDGALPADETESDEPAAPARDGHAAVVISTNGYPVKMRATPSQKDKSWIMIPTGTVVEVIDAGAPWSKIRHAGKDGFMMTEFLGLVGDIPDTGEDADQDALEDPSLETRLKDLEEDVEAIQEKLGMEDGR